MRNLVSAGELAATVRLALPISVIQLGALLMGTVDVIMLGRVSDVALASGGVGNALGLGLLVFPLGLLSGLDALASQAHGAGDVRRLGRYFQQGLVLAVILTVPISVVMWEGRPLLQALGQPPEIAAGAAGYLRGALFGNLAVLVYAVCQRTLQAMSIVRPAFAAMVVGNVANLASDYALIFGKWGFPALGAAGAGWATSISRWVMLACLLAFARRPLAPCWRRRAAGLGRRRDYATFLRIGSPVGFHISFEYWLFMAVTLMMGHLGAREAASHQVAINMTALAYMVAVGFAGAASTRVGNAVGRRDADGARRAAATCLLVGTGLMLVFGAAFLLAPRLLARLYTTDPAVIALASTLLPIAACFEIFDGLQAICGGVLRGAADTRVPALVALVGYWALGLPLGAWLTFGAGWGPQGLWWGLTLGLLTVALLLLGRVAWRFKTEVAAIE
jgi:MATE family multidrug resistance protein